MISETKSSSRASSDISDADGFPREIAPGIWWLGGCLSIKLNDKFGIDTAGVAEIHSHISCFLIVGTNQSLMVDTGYPAHWKRVSEHLDRILGSRPLDWIIPTHWEVPHTGNLEKLFKKYPNLQAGGDLRDYHLAYPEHQDRIHILEPEHKIDLGGGYRFVVLPALIKDLVNTAWGFEEREKVLFTADGISFTHHIDDTDQIDTATGDDTPRHVVGECSLMSHELGVYPTVEQAIFLTKAALYWARLTPVEPFFAELSLLLKKYPPKLIAPAHGSVVTDIDKMLPIIRQAHEAAYAQGATI